jgi:hypothetical protein
MAGLQSVFGKPSAANYSYLIVIVTHKMPTFAANLIFTVISGKRLCFSALPAKPFTAEL